MSYLEQLSIKAYQHIWSAINQPNLQEHSGQKILSLLLAKANALQRIVLEGFAKTKSTSNAESVVIEIQNILVTDTGLTDQISAIIDNSKHDPLMPLPSNVYGEGTTFTDAGSYNTTILIGALLIVAPLIIWPMTGRLFYGAILVGFGFIIKGLSK